MNNLVRTVSLIKLYHHCIYSNLLQLPGVEQTSTPLINVISCLTGLCRRLLTSSLMHITCLKIYFLTHKNQFKLWDHSLIKCTDSPLKAVIYTYINVMYIWNINLDSVNVCTQLKHTHPAHPPTHTHQPPSGLTFSISRLKIETCSSLPGQKTSLTQETELLESLLQEVEHQVGHSTVLLSCCAIQQELCAATCWALLIYSMNRRPQNSEFESPCWTASLLQQEWTHLKEPRDPAHVPAGPSQTHAVLCHYACPSRLYQVNLSWADCHGKPHL